MKYLFMVVCTLISCSLTAAISWHGEAEGGFLVDVNIPKTDIGLGDTIDLFLILTYPKGYSFDIQSLKNNLLSHTPFKAAPFTIKNESINTENVGGSEVTNIHFTLQSQLDGIFYLTFYSITFSHQTLKRNPAEIVSDLFEISVTQPSIDLMLPSLPSKALLPLSLNPPIAMNDENKNNLLDNVRNNIEEAQKNESIASEKSVPWLEIFIFLLIVTLLYLTHVAPKYSKKLPTPQKQALHAREKALSKLKTLRKNPPEPKQYYVELTDAIRHYIEEQYQIRAPSYTTQEFLHETTMHPFFSPITQEAIAQFLKNADKIKFARYEPSDEECAEAHAAAKRVISY